MAYEKVKPETSGKDRRAPRAIIKEAARFRRRQTDKEEANALDKDGPYHDKEFVSGVPIKADRESIKLHEQLHAEARVRFEKK